MQEGYDGLLRDKTRPSRIPRLDSSIIERVVTLTQTDPPAEATHWTSAMMAKVVDISASSIQRIWRSHGLQPHRVKQFKLSTDPQFAEKLSDSRPVRRSSRPCGSPLGRREEIPWGVDSDRRSGRVRLLTHPLWRRPCKLSLTDPRLRPLSAPI